MIDLLLAEMVAKLNLYFGLRSKGGPGDLFECVTGDVSLHDKSAEGGGEELFHDKVILTLISVEEENAMRNNYPIREIGSTFVKEKSAVYVNVFLLFSARYETYVTSVQAISHVISCFQATRRLLISVNGEEQEAVLNLHNLGFENLNNLWTVMGGRYLPSVIYKARVLMFQQAPPVGGALITDIQGTETV
ncbi:DUF4255 domain-containing protein [Chitinophaga sp. 22321]|uniref:DUF4255 domain-containing protein n=1 Tax=Chitinophaga hostae TaxID=2831022 RepID=A0ABS5J461_9BACT|nr:DUF4255 domain-containing protein [Chitinophaga hostae]MBS0030009.1 DUF4255 domain-containing protein [Chitinophaga hostae]